MGFKDYPEGPELDALYREGEKRLIAAAQRARLAEGELRAIRLFCLERGVTINVGETTLEAVRNLATVENTRGMKMARELDVRKPHDDAA